jgi:Carboxypeptidase regulatory-like domain
VYLFTISPVVVRFTVRLAVAVSTLLTLAVSMDHAQVDALVSEVKVTVVDQSGAVIADSEIVFKFDSRTITSHVGNDGSVTVTLPSARYVVIASHPGFLKNEVSDFQVVAPQPRELKIVLMADPTPMCGPSVSSSPIVTTTASDVSSAVTPAPAREFPAQPVARRTRSWHCLYLWKCSTS